MATLFLLTLACTPPDGAKDADTAVGHDTDTDTESDTDTPADTDPPEPDPTFDLAITRGDCDALVAPWSVTTAEEVVAAADGVIADRSHLLDGLIYFMSGAMGCPGTTQVVDGDTTTTTYAGGCTGASGMAVTGTMVYEVVGEDQEDATFTFEAVTVRKEDGADTYHFAIDGTYGNVGNTFWMDFAWGESGTGIYETPRVFGVLDLEEVYAHDGEGSRTGYTRSGYTWRDDERLAGDFCLEQTVVYGDGTCAAEWESEGVTLSGAVEATVTRDGVTTCDDCAVVRLDGVDLGEVCPG